MKFFSRVAGAVPAFLAAWFAGCAASTRDIPAVRDFDLGRYLGRWYEIARLPHRFERGLEFVRAEYTLAPDGSVRVVNSGVRDGETRRVTGVARLKDQLAENPDGELEVSFFRPFYGAYRIIELDPEYRYAIVTSSARNCLWILSRTPAMEKRQLDGILERLGKLGFAVEKLEYPRQSSGEL